jgi:hypothetical protein
MSNINKTPMVETEQVNNNQIENINHDKVNDNLINLTSILQPFVDNINKIESIRETSEEQGREMTKGTNMQIISNTSSTELTKYMEEPFSVKNEAKGDDIHNKNQQDLRIMFQNVNNLRPQSLDKWKASLERIKYLQCDMTGLCETGVNWTNISLKNSFEKCMRKQFRNSNLETSSATVQLYDRKNLPGGTAILSAGKWSNRIISSISDTSGMGRWSGIKIRVSDEQSLYYFSVYRVCEQHINGTNSMSTYTQQYRILEHQGFDSPNPRQQVLIDISKTISAIDSKDYIMIGMDANENWCAKNSKIKNFTLENNLVDVYSEKHEDNRDFPTHINGSKRIDYLLCSKNLLPYINKTGIVKFHEGLDSDHRALFCDIDQKLFTNITEEYMRKTRQIGTNSTNREGIKYIRTLDQQLKNHRIYEKIENIYNEVFKKDNQLDESKIMEEINKLDKIITKSMLYAEKNVVKRKNKYCGHQLYTNQTW